MYERSSIFNVEGLRRTRSKAFGGPLCAGVLPCMVVIAFAVLPAVAQPREDMVVIPSGEFLMGDHNDSMPFALPIHAVYLDSFNMDVHEVTNESYACALNWAWEQQLITVSGGVVYKAGGSEQYCDTHSASSDSRIHWDAGTETFSVTGENLPPEDVGNKTQHPMVQVSWYGSAAYTNWRSAMDGRALCYDTSTWECDFAADGYRLPTEAEWEYAARGGECTGGEHDPYCRYPWGDTIDGSMANYRDSGDPFEGSAPKTTPVGYYDGNQTPAGSDMANGYGLYDMAGNVYEYCNDLWGAYSHCDPAPCINPIGPQSGTTNRVARGGSWGNLVGALRCGGERTWEAPHWRWPYHGFRVVLAMTDCNNNGVPDDQDIANGESQDCNENGIPDECEDDLDGDGVIDDCDECPDSDLGAVIVIDGCDTGVDNQLLEDGCTMADLIAECADGVATHGAYVRCIDHLTNFWKCDGLIAGAEKGHIQSCAAQADIP